MTGNQRALLTLLKDGGYIRWHCSPGKDRGGHHLCKKGDHRDLDSRTVNSLETRGWIKPVGDGDYEITDAGKTALTA